MFSLRNKGDKNNFLVFVFFFFFFFFFLNTSVTNYNRKEKTQQKGLGNPKLKLRTKVRGGNASEYVGSLTRGTDATKSGSPLKVISKVYLQLLKIKINEEEEKTKASLHVAPS
jgi:hypothetical protein